MLFLEGIARGDWFGAIVRVREGVSECGFVLEERPFSGVAMNFLIELLGARARVRDLAPALQQREEELRSAVGARLGAYDFLNRAPPAAGHKDIQGAARRFPPNDFSLTGRARLA